MPTLTQIVNAGLTFTLPTRPINEPINASPLLVSSLGRFGDDYDTSNGSNLYKFLVALCGEAGAGSLKKGMLYPRLQAQLESTHFTDLDKIYGSPIGIPRLPEELYQFDPRGESLTQNQWDQILAADAQYRHRCLVWMRALQAGPNPVGIALAGEAALGVRCDVYERYTFLENLSSDMPVSMPDLGQTDSPNEFVVIPETISVSQGDRRVAIYLLDQLRPINTIPTITNGQPLSTSLPISDIEASTEAFYVKKLVTGNPNISWPTPDPSQGLWITTSQEEAPTFAFMNSQESTTFLTVANVSSSSEHIGMFNITQQALFGFLNQTIPPFTIFSAQNSYNAGVIPIQLNTTFTSSGSNNTVLVDTYYPITYFTSNPIAQAPLQTIDFWSSVESEAPGTETLIFDFGVPRPINFIDFEISYKPVDLLIEYSTDQINWTGVDYDPDFVPTTSVSFIPTASNQWNYVENHFELVTAQYIRITFTKRTDPFPLNDSLPFAWSVDVRNLRNMYIIVDSDDFITDTGTDILGNTFSNDLVTYPATNSIDSDTSTFWKSQPNTVRNAVECLYCDLRNTAQQGTMSFLDEWESGFLDSRSMADMESYLENGVVIDEIYIDPLTYGPWMHLYYSLDDTPGWDNKQWVPVPQLYTLKKGFFSLPTSTYVKYMKLEFTNLTAIPYHIPEYPSLPPVITRLFPNWILDYFSSQTLGSDGLSAVTNFNAITVDPIALGFRPSNDSLNSGQEIQLPPSLLPQTNETQNTIDSLVSQIETATSTAPSNQNEVQFNSPYVWSSDLSQLLDTTRALSRFVQQGESPWLSEATPIATPPPVAQGVLGLVPSAQEKQTPPMYFPFTTSHDYQFQTMNRNAKIAYYVGIKEIQFCRRDYSVTFDEPLYIETFADTANFGTVNDFLQDDWRYVILP